ncbi:MAG: NrtA/SsuA/CpmA family ABC transporter substrate-binding protein [Treponema sp.]|jgi:NitT/TauT family transport system substrate-binding protein/sulfonate transport system substrate-binding protein|nr:NrtA/SsuA/CpmA family ABC transporter substrate-binding protein [Treponema sp.]
MGYSKITGIICFCFLSTALVFGAGKKETYPKVVNISYVESPFNLQIMVMKEKRLLEKAFAEKNITVTWHNINSGADQTQAMAAGSLDIASVINSTSVILANAAGNRVEIAAAVSRPKQTFALMTGPHGPQSVGELKGKTIAGPKGTVLHQMLIAALVAEGMGAADVTLMQMGLPESRTALISGQIDGALQAAALIIRDEEAGMKVLFTADGYLTPLLLTAVRPEFAKKYPELLQMYLDVQQQAYSWILANTTEAVAIGSKMQEIAEADGLRLYQWSGMAAALEPGDVPALSADVAFLLEQDMITQSVNPEDFILPIAYGK